MTAEYRGVVPLMVEYETLGEVHNRSPRFYSLDLYLYNLRHFIEAGYGRG